MSGDLCLTSVHVMSHFHPSHQSYIAVPSGSCLTSIQVPGFVFHLQPVVSRSREFHFISIQVPYHPQCISQNVRLTIIQVSSDLSPDQKIRVSPPSRSVHPGCVLPPCRSRELHFSSMGVSSHPHPSLNFCISPPSRSCLSSVPTPRFASHLHLGSNIHVSPPSKSHMTSIQIPLFVSQLRPGPISPHSSPEMCVSSSSRYRLTASEHQFIYLTSIHFPSLIHPGT